MQLHRRVGLFGDHSRQGEERGFEDAVNGKLVQLVQRQVHELGKIPLDHQTLADQAPHHVAHCAEFAQRHQGAKISVAVRLERLVGQAALNLQVHVRGLLMRGLRARRHNARPSAIGI